MSAYPSGGQDDEDSSTPTLAPPCRHSPSRCLACSGAGADPQSLPLPIPHPAGRTLLPRPLAHAVSVATRSTGLAIRVGSTIGSCGLDAARVATLSSLDLGRGVVEGILTRAGSEVVARWSGTELARRDAETALERGLESLHQAMTQVVFWASAGFHAASASLAAAGDASQLALAAVDQLLGATESSRAIAAIVTLIRREFEHPATGAAGERVGVLDLALGLCSLAYLQSRCWRMGPEEDRRRAMEDVVWDVVVLEEDGERVDVGPLPEAPGREDEPRTGAVLLQDHPDGGGTDPDEERLKEQMLPWLPEGAEVSVSTSTATTKMITVEFLSGGRHPAELFAPPPGLRLVEERPAVLDAGPGRPLRGQPPQRDQQHQRGYRLVYRVDRNETSHATYQKVVDPAADDHRRREAKAIAAAGTVVAADSASSAATSTSALPAPPPPPPPPPPSSAPAAIQPYSRIPAPRPERNEANKKKLRTPYVAPVQMAAEPPARTSSAGLAPATKMKHADKLRQAFRRGGGFGPDRPKKPLPPLPPLPTAPPAKPTAGAATTNPPAAATTAAEGRRRGNHTKGSTPTRGASRPEDDTRESFLPIATRSPSRTSVGSSPAHDNKPDGQHHLHHHHHNSPRLLLRTDPVGPSGSTSGPPSPTVHNHRRRRSHYSIGTNDSTTSLALLSVSSSANCHHQQLDHHSHSHGYGHGPLPQQQPQHQQPQRNYHRSAYGDDGALSLLRRDGTVEGVFPRGSLLHNISRYMRFSSASYGSSFLTMMGLARPAPGAGAGPISTAAPPAAAVKAAHRDVQSFARHTASRPDSILLSSFVDPHGGSDATGSTDTGVPLVHYISLDHEARAVVLACRGTLGFEDVLADMTCDYDELTWRGRPFQVHKGVHASARRILYGGDGRVLFTLREALDAFEDYGLVLCGHSLGGAVTSVLGIMLAEPNRAGKGFVTSAEPHHHRGMASSSSPVCLPAGRPIHVYAYGPPGTVSPRLGRATRGLISSVVHGNDLVPYLSLGVLRDLQAAALALKRGGQAPHGDQSGGRAGSTEPGGDEGAEQRGTQDDGNGDGDGDDGGATGGQAGNVGREEMRRRIWSALQTGLAERWHQNAPPSCREREAEEEGRWALAALQGLRSGMRSCRLLPPGDVFVVEGTPVLRRDSFASGGNDIGRPARRIVLKYVRDVEARFGEVRFGGRMLMDHSPVAYEEVLALLRRGVEGGRL